MSGPPIRPPLHRKGAGFLQRPPLKLKPFIMDAELHTAEQQLKLKGLTKAIVDAAVDSAAANRAEVNSLLRFIAMSSYLYREEPAITREIAAILNLRSREDKLRTLSKFLLDTFKGWGQNAPMGETVAEDLVDKRTSSTQFLQGGLLTLLRLAKQNKGLVDATAMELVSHANGMDAKLYARWVHHFTVEAKKKAPDAVKTIHVKLGGQSDAQYGYQWFRKAWQVMVLVDGTPMSEADKVAVGTTYYFHPPDDKERAFIGVVLSYAEKTGEMSISVTQVM